MNKVSLQTSLERNPSNLSYISFSGVNFENLTVEFYVPYVINIHIKGMPQLHSKLKIIKNVKKKNNPFCIK